MLAASASAAAAGAGAPETTATDTTVTVSPRVVIAAPQSSPIAFPGITRVREGAALPRGWVVVSRDVQIVRGSEVAFAAFRMTCPKDTTWRGGTASDDIAASVLDRDARSRKRSVLVLATFATSAVRAGETATGKVFALCR
ncbi:MAG TPA: hypothetical protein VGO80_01225 [Solirubrobacteraceae bacterium]|jgi:hypothetical protein|nr:hypothetical protein [Solirubrobacteraceae bacterium]